MLKSIQLTGFKSFAKKGSLSFESPITAIVGPNGSGKSNTAEAFRFVLGEQGSKSMRVKKGTDLIWGGSHTLPKGSRAGVKVVLDNSKNKLNIDFNEVVIERSVLRDGTNEYSINGSKVRLKDIQDLLAGANVGSSGHHIISQGEADRVLGASPKERKEMLEDALGLKAYQIKKIEANRKLDATGLNLAKAESRHRELLPHLKFLARQVARVEQAQQVKEQLKAQAGVYFAREQVWITTEEADLKKSIPQPREDIKRVEIQIQTIRKSIEDAKILSANKNSDNQSNTEVKITEQKNKLISLRSTLATLRTELGKVSGQLEMLKVVEQKAKSLPSSISRTEVKALLLQIIQALESGDSASAKGLTEKFIKQKLETEQVEEKKEDNALEQEKAGLIKVQRELAEQIAGQEQAISGQEAAVAETQAQAAKESNKETEHERDLYKATAEYNQLKATLAELGRRQENLTERQQALSDNISEVQVLIGEELYSGRTPEFGDQTTESVSPHLSAERNDLNGGRHVPTRRDIERLKIQLEQHGTLGTGVVAEHKEAAEHHDFLNQEITDLQSAASKLSELIKELDIRMHEQFTKGLELVNREFNDFFMTLFDGGSAHLQLVELKSTSDDPECDEEKEKQYGVEVRVNLPRKKVTTLETLSGGERALASIALIFAMSQVNPPPFIILDETDAALDEANSGRYANIVKQLSERSQIILITHNRATMAAADTLYGVTMCGDGVSQLLSVKLTEAEQFAK